MPAYGFRPSRHLTGGTIRASEYLIAASYTTQVFTGDPVKINAGYINVAAAGDTMVGVFGGVQYKNDKGEIKFSRYWTGEANATEIKAFVYDDPNILYSAYDDGVGDYLTQADIGKTGDHVAGSGSTITGVSGYMIDTSTVGGTGNDGWRFVGIDTVPGNAFGAANGAQVEGLWLCNEHLYR